MKQRSAYYYYIGSEELLTDNYRCSTGSTHGPLVDSKDGYENQTQTIVIVEV